ETWRGRPWQIMYGLPRPVRRLWLQIKTCERRQRGMGIPEPRQAQHERQVYARLCNVSRILSKLGRLPALSRISAYRTLAVLSITNAARLATPWNPMKLS